MSLSVSIHDYDSGLDIDVTSRVQSVEIEEPIDGPASFSIELKNLTETHAFDDVTISYGGSPLFVGVIEEQTDALRGGSSLIRFSSLSGSDYSKKFEKRVVNLQYLGEKVEDIIADLLVQHPTGITVNNVGVTNKTIESIAFPYVYLSDCIDQLAEITGWRWYVDKDKDLHFFDVSEGTGNTVFSTSADGGLTRNILRESIEMQTVIDGKTANRVWIIGAKTSSPAFVDQYWTGDGLNDSFAINYEPNYPQVKEGGVTKTISLERGTTPDTDYTYDKKKRILRRVTGPLNNGVQLHLRHRPTTQVIDYFEDSASIATYGVYEKAIKDKQITERLAARSKGRAELKRRATDKKSLSFELFGNVEVQRGMRYRVVIPELSVDSFWLCTRVVTSISAPDTVNIIKSVEMEAV